MGMESTLSDSRQAEVFFRCFSCAFMTIDNIKGISKKIVSCVLFIQTFLEVYTGVAVNKGIQTAWP